MYSSSATSSSLPPPRCDSPVPVAGGPSASELPLAVWDQRTLTRTFRAIANEAAPALATAASQSIASRRARNPGSLREIASLGVPQWTTGGPIVTFDQARASQWPEFDGAYAVFPPGHYPALGRGPQLLAQHLVKTAAPFDPSLVRAFTKMEPYYQAELLRMLQPHTIQGTKRCEEIMSHLPATRRGPLIAALSPDFRTGWRRCQAMLDSLSQSDRLALAENAVRAGLPLSDIEMLCSFSEHDPDLWDLEYAAVRAPAVAHAISEGMSYEQLEARYGKFYTPTARHYLEMLFCTTVAETKLRGGAGCAEVLESWGPSLIFREAGDLRFVVFRHEPEALQTYEVNQGLRPRLEGAQFGRLWVSVLGEPSDLARAGVPVAQLLRQHQLDDRFRFKLEMASCYGQAGRNVYSGTCSAAEAMERHQLRSRSALLLLGMAERARKRERLDAAFQTLEAAGRESGFL